MAKLPVFPLQSLARAKACGFRLGSFAKQNSENQNALRFGSPCTNQNRFAVFKIFHQVLEPYVLEDETKVHFTRCFRSSLHGFVSLETAGFFKGKTDVESSFDMLIENNLALLAGLASKKNIKK
jgi:hypothetical protein